MTHTAGMDIFKGACVLMTLSILMRNSCARISDIVNIVEYLTYPRLKRQFRMDSCLYMLRSLPLAKRLPTILISECGDVLLIQFHDNL